MKYVLMYLCVSGILNCVLMIIGDAILDRNDAILNRNNERLGRKDSPHLLVNPHFGDDLH